MGSKSPLYRANVSLCETAEGGSSRYAIFGAPAMMQADPPVKYCTVVAVAHGRWSRNRVPYVLLNLP